MTWLFPAAVSATVATALLFGVYAYVYALYRERYMGMWTGSWAGFTVNVLVVTLLPTGLPGGVLLLIGGLGGLVGAWLLAWGVLDFLGKRAHPALHVAAAAVAAWTVAGGAFDFSLALVSAPGAVYAGVIFLWLGVLLLRRVTTPRLGRRLVGAILVIWGVHKLDYPLLRPVEWFAPWGYALAVLFAFLVGAGILILYFERVRGALEQSEQRFRRIVEQAGDLAFLFDLDTGALVEANRAACEALGYDVAELRRIGFTEVSLGYSALGVAEMFARLGGERVFTLDDRLRARDGHTFPVEVRVSQVTEGERQLVLAFARDVSDRWRAQAEHAIVSEVAKTFLQSGSLEQVHAVVPKILVRHLRYPIAAIELYDAARDVLRYVGTAGMGTFLPVGTELPATETISGEVVHTGRPIALEDASDHPAYRAPSLRRFGVKAFVSAPLRLRGEVVGSVSMGDTQRRDDVAETVATLGIIADYLAQELDRRRMERALQRELEIDTALTQLSQQLLAPGVDERQSAALVVEMAKRLTGSPLGCVGGLSSSLDTGDDAPTTLTALESWCVTVPLPGTVWGEAGASSAGGAEVLPDGGGTEIVRFVLVPVRFEADVLGRLLVANAEHEYAPRERRVVEQLAEMLAYALQGKLAEDERKALQEQVWEAQKMQGLGTLAGGIAHDFNNILSAILGYAELSLDLTADGSELRTNVDEIVRACHRAAALVRQILTFGRRADDERRLLQPSLVVKETLQLLRASLPAGIAITRDIDDEAGPLLADPSQLQQIVMNLCTNAFHAMASEGGTLSVQLRPRLIDGPDGDVPRELPHGLYAELVVSDTGVGMDDATRARIFEPYFTTKSQGEGSGLGLAVVHGVVSTLNGAVTVTSQPGEGATFRVLLPAQDASADELPAGFPRAAVEGTERVLLVDDEETLVTVGRSMLVRLGYRVSAFRDADAALAAFRSAPDAFDVVVTDLNMPRLNGIALAASAREIRADMPVVLFTGNLDDLSRLRLRNAGVRVVVPKPLSSGALGAAIRCAVDGRGPDPAAGAET